MTYIIIIGAIIFALVFYMTNREKSNKKKVDAEEEARKQSAAAELWDKAHEQQEKDWKEEREKQYQQEREKMNQKSELEKKEAAKEEKVSEKKIAAAKQARKKPAKKSLTKEEKRVKELKEMANDIFRDCWPEYDYSHLEPEQAERKLERLKEEEGWIDDDQYHALIRIINGACPVTDLPYRMENAEPEELFKWFVKAYDEAEDGFSTRLMKEIGKRLKPYQEPMLLEELASIDPISVEEWMEDKKKEGYFFSPKVYSACKKKWLGQYDL